MRTRLTREHDRFFVPEEDEGRKFGDVRLAGGDVHVVGGDQQDAHLVRLVVYVFQLVEDVLALGAVVGSCNHRKLFKPG